MKRVVFAVVVAALVLTFSVALVGYRLIRHRDCAEFDFPCVPRDATIVPVDSGVGMVLLVVVAAIVVFRVRRASRKWSEYRE